MEKLKLLASSALLLLCLLCLNCEPDYAVGSRQKCQSCSESEDCVGSLVCLPFTKQSGNRDILVLRCADSKTKNCPN